MYQLVGAGGEGALLCPYRPFADATKNLFLARWVFGRVEWDPTARGLATDRCGGVNREVLGTVYTGKRGPDEKKNSDFYGTSSPSAPLPDSSKTLSDMLFLEGRRCPFRMVRAWRETRRHRKSVEKE